MEECPDCRYELLTDEVGDLYCPVCGKVWEPEPKENIVLGYN